MSERSRSGATFHIRLGVGRHLHGISNATVLSVVLLGIIVLIVVYPLLVMLGDLIRERVGSVQPLFGQGGLDRGVLVVLANTVVVVVGGSAIAVCIGSLLAWLNERTDGRLGVSGDFLPLAPLLVPTVAGVVAWLILLDPRIGYFNLAIRGFLRVLGITLKQGPFNILTRGGLIALTAVHLVPLAYLVVSATLRRLDPSLEEASRVSGASIWRTFTRVTFPAITPALASASLLCVIFGVGLFSVPLVVGTSAGIELLSVRIFFYISTGFPLPHRPCDRSRRNDAGDGAAVDLRPKTVRSARRVCDNRGEGIQIEQG